jgi:hypothetical protein
LYRQELSEQSNNRQSHAEELANEPEDIAPVKLRPQARWMKAAD